MDDLEEDHQDRISVSLALRDERFRQPRGDEKPGRRGDRRFRSELGSLEALLGLLNEEYALPRGASDGPRQRPERSGPIATQLRRPAADDKLK